MPMIAVPSKPTNNLFGDPEYQALLKDPVRFKQLFWPGSLLTDYQAEILTSIQRNKITVVPAGNKLGKDHIAAFASLQFFCSRTPCKVVTTSVNGTQLNSVLWGEIRTFIQTAVMPLPVKVNDLQLRQYNNDGTLVGNSELIGRVVDQGEGLLGWHLPFGPKMEPRVLCVIDEASGFSDNNYMGIDTWAHRILIIGNPFPCANFFKRLVLAGDQKSDAPHLDYDVKIIKIPASKSPNVRLALEEERLGLPISRRIIVPGCLDIDDYRYRLKTYDPVKLSAGIHAEFYEGEEVKLFPGAWLQMCKEVAETLRECLYERSSRRAIGIDTAEGGDNTVWTVVDHLGVIEQVSKKTRNTSIIKGRTIAMIKKYDVNPSDVLFDRGGGGKEHADYIRDAGYPVRSVGFGESPTSADENLVGWTAPEDKENLKEQKYAYKNKRAQLYGVLREMINPDRSMTSLKMFRDEESDLSEEIKALRGVKNGVFGIPAKYEEIFRQLAPLPLLYDGEGRMYLPPKDSNTPQSKGVTIKKLIGCSPDETDSLALAVFALVFQETVVKVGAF